ncbi:DNA replication licensing factor mcm10 [Lachnellula suecica]|uniref:DNA replication licensing factor mcm10 n=1 Tax=Lachnellula suecica TaxID=602035 RepID=A0A8T9BYH0_9HELO|nr:DNA replication licensing factor mcm10 [Lachnellula suecica]
MSQAGNPEWPPRSPHDVLLSTPGGRKRLQRLAERTSPSPSPLKRTASSLSARNRAKDLMKADMEGGDSDEDEETLQLQLQEIQTRLKLKKLQKKSKQSSDTENEKKTGSAPLARENSAAASRAQSRLDGLREERLEKERSKSQASIDVPVSPVRRAQPIETQKSPKRVLLGIDKGLTGRDISLKRAPSLRKREDVDIPERRMGPFLQRPISQIGGRAGSVASSHDEDRPKTFSERMAAIRSQESSRQERELRIKKNRSTAFDIDQNEIQNFKETAVEFPDAPRQAAEFSRDEILNGVTKPGGLSRSKTTPNLRSAMRDTSNIATGTTTRTDSRASVDVPPRKQSAPKSNVPPGEVTEADASQFEPYSSAHLSKRIIPHHILTRTLTGKKTFLVPDLLRIVKSPDFSGPDVEEDIVVFAIIAKKTQPMVHQQNVKNEKRGKYMIMGLTDLKWELDLFLFDSAFDKFWKLTPGTIIAILNPTFMPPPKGRSDTGKFSLVLNSDADTILEIGSARDLGFCKSIKKDGKTCDSWVDKRHTEFCDFHVNQTLAKTHSKRMEVNTMTFGKGDYGRKKYNSRDVPNWADRAKQKEDNKQTRYDRESHSQIFIGKKSTVNMLDDVDFDPDAFHRGSTKEERMTRRILAQEKERELEKKLEKMGNGLGADYMRARSQPSQTSMHTHPSSTEPAPPDAAALGLLSGKAKDVALSPVKRKRVNTASSSAAIGWGADLSKDLERMKNGESLQPVKKKTRFVTEKGIREAGRESLGGKEVLVSFSSDDDELDIVRE